MALEPFEEKYRELPMRWNINPDLVSYIVRRYTKKFEEELTRLDNEPLELSKYFIDNRTSEEYLYDLIDGWLVEDIVCDAWLRARIIDRAPLVEIVHMGTNRERVVQRKDQTKITTDPDFVFESAGKKREVELQMARKLLRAGYDMKEGKVSQAIERESSFLWVLMPSSEFFVVKPDEDLVGTTPIANPAWGGKMVYRISNERIRELGLHLIAEPIPDEILTKLGVSL